MLPPTTTLGDLLARHAARVHELEASGARFKVCHDYEQFRADAREHARRANAFHRARGWLRGVDLAQMMGYGEPTAFQAKVEDELERIYWHEARPALVAEGVEPIDDASLGTVAPRSGR